MEKIIFSVLFIAVFYACNNDSDVSVEVRLQNISEYDFKNIIVNDTPYNDLDEGEFSDYKSFERIYRYTFIELTIDGYTQSIIPIDYVGETPLPGGKYTYRLDANGSPEQDGMLSMELVEN